MLKVTLRECNGTLQLRWTVQGRRVTLSLGLKDSPENRVLGERKARQIEDDIIFGDYDPTLEKYKPKKAVDPPLPKSVTLLECWSAYMTGHVVTLAEKTQAQYATFSNHIQRLPSHDLNKPYEIRDYLVKTFSADMTKRLIVRINAACKWSQQRGLIEKNPFEGLTSNLPKVVKKTNQIEVFTPSEINAILSAYEQHRTYQRFFPFLRFLALTGCRPEEALGLRWVNVLEESLIFSEAITYLGGKAIQRTQTKTSVDRVFPINDELAVLLGNLKRGKDSHLVFPSQQKPDIPINYNHFLRSWKGGNSGQKHYTGIVTKLVEQGIVNRYKSPYAFRHSFITRCLEKGVSPVQIARWCGNTPRTIYEHYAGVLSDRAVPGLD